MRDAVRYKLIDGLAAFVLFVCCFPVHACWSEAAARYRLSTELLYAIARTESSLAPHAVAHNQDGTRDLGLMQVNSRWLPRLATYGISEQALLQPCTNINVGAWILAGNVKRLGYTWDAVGAYNAASPSKRAAYILTLPRFHVHQDVDNFLMNGGMYEQEDAGPESAVHEGVQGGGGTTGRVGWWQ